MPADPGCFDQKMGLSVKSIEALFLLDLEEDDDDPWRRLPYHPADPDRQARVESLILSSPRHRTARSAWAMMNSQGYTSQHPKPTHGFPKG